MMGWDHEDHEPMFFFYLSALVAGWCDDVNNQLIIDCRFVDSMWDVFWNNMEHLMVSMVSLVLKHGRCWVGDTLLDSMGRWWNLSRWFRNSPRLWPVWSISHPTWSLFCKIGRKIWASSMALNSWSQRKMPAICAVKKLKILSSNFCSRLDHLGSVILPSKQSDCLLWDVQRETNELWGRL